jgi:hypothetical protein
MPKSRVKNKKYLKAHNIWRRNMPRALNFKRSVPDANTAIKKDEETGRVLMAPWLPKSKKERQKVLSNP